MADGVAITAGSGTTIATDDCTTAGHTQIVKLAISTDGSATLIPAEASNGLDVDVTRVSGTVTVAGTVAGDVAHDTGDSGNPVKAGGRAIADLAAATMVAAADRSDLLTGLDGVLLTRPYTTISNVLVERLSNTDGASTASTVFGATASAKNCITTIAVYNAHASTSGYIDFRDGTGGTVLFTLPLPAGGGAVVNFPVPLVQSTANTAFAYDVSAAITTVYISLIGFKSKA